VLTPDGLYGARDPNGFRPLCLGRIEGGWVLASETCALDAAGAVFIRDLAPGELLSIDDDGMTSLRIGESVGKPSLCIFEYIYFARPDSDIAGQNVHQVRKEMGRYLARDHFVEADVVTGVPDSSISAASGYAEEAGIPYEMGLVRNRYIGRTFIQPGDELRQRGVKLKLNPLRKVVRDRRVVLVDDSVVRGTTSKILVRLLREAGAREIHLRISSPPYRYPCYYGIDTSARGQLIAAERSVEEIRSAVGADSLEYLSVERVAEAAGATPSDFCVACFMGDYRVGVDPDADGTAEGLQ
ncbi:MAG: amidophosphoribosyltransferase, partial [Bacillota bacterium]